MGSIQTKKTEQTIALWKKNFSEQVYVLEKLDGISCLLSIKNGNIFLSTRGDGKEGKDITFLRYYLNIFDKEPSINRNYDIRGEIVIQKNESL